MLLTVGIVWGLLLLTTPLFLLRIYSLYGSGISKLIISFLAYFFLSCITFLLIIFSVVGPDPRPNHAIPVISKVFCLILVLAYGAAGWLLGSFINGKLITSLSFLSLRGEEPQSIFNTK
jgi:hypothetical protein